MEENLIKISNLNDFIFCPRSIYFHNIYNDFDEKIYHTDFQVNGKNAHKSINLKKYSSKKDIIQSIDVFSDELGVIGKIDLYDKEKKTLIERKNKIKVIYEGYYLQIYAEYFCLIEMGYDVEKIYFYSIKDNKRYKVEIPKEKEKNRLKDFLMKIKEFSLDKPFTQNRNKCNMCIYKELCDYYKNDI